MDMLHVHQRIRKPVMAAGNHLKRAFQVSSLWPRCGYTHSQSQIQLHRILVRAVLGIC